VNDLEIARGMVLGFLDSAGIDTYEAAAGDDVWLFRRGSARGHLALIEDREEPEWSRIYVSYAVIRVPADASAAFFRRLLELNEKFGGMCGFSIGQDGIVWLTAGRRLDGLDPGELEDLVVRTGYYADRYDDVLLDEFGRDLAC